MIEVVWASCEFSLLVSQQNRSDLSLNALDVPLMRFYLKKGIFREQKLPKCAKAEVHVVWATDSHQLCEQKIHKIRAAIAALVYVAEKVSTTKHRQFKVYLNRAWHAATIWSDSEYQKAIERLERQVHQVTHVKCKVFNKWFPHHDQQLLKEVRTNAPGPRHIFPQPLALMKAATEEEAYRVANMTTNQRVHLQICLSDGETEPTTLSLAVTEYITIQLWGEISGISSNEQKQFKKKFSIPLI